MTAAAKKADRPATASPTASTPRVVPPALIGHFAIATLLRDAARPDVHARRVTKGDGTVGWTLVPTPITDEMLRQHVTGEGPPLGVYLLAPGARTATKTQLAVLDLDDHDAMLEWSAVTEAAMGLMQELSEFGFQAFPVRSGGGRGIHLWLLWQTPQPIHLVRCLLLDALQGAGWDTGDSGLARGHVELFPKADEAVAGGYGGGMVALPFARSSVPLDPETLEVLSEPRPISKHPQVPSVMLYEPHHGARPRLRPTLDVIRSALEKLPADEHSMWVRVGLALKNGYGDAGLEVWDAWSSTSSKFREGECQRKWRTLHPNGSITPASIVFMAKRVGWVAPHAIDLEEMNERFAHVMWGTSDIVLEETIDPEHGHLRADFITPKAFKAWNRGAFIEVDSGGRPRKEPLADYWLGWSGRRKYRHVEFAPPPLRVAPNTYNLFQGWAVEPKPGDCSLFLEHLSENVCGGNTEYFNWVLDWLADIVQSPGRKPGTALVLRGIQGSGKTTLADVMMRLLGRQHVFKAEKQEQVTGKFNEHLKQCVLLDAEEAVWAGDKAAEGSLKHLITSDMLAIEKKGKDLVQMRNCVRVLVTSNNEWVVPKQFGDRRFTVLDVGDKRLNDYAFFAALEHQMESGGYGALMQLLVDRRYSQVTLRHGLDTPGGRDQQLRSFLDWESWLVDLCDNGILPGDKDGDGETLTGFVYESYEKHAKGQGSRRPLVNIALGRKLHDTFPTLERAHLWSKGTRFNTYVFPPLGECRRVLLERFRTLAVRWDLEEEWSSWSSPNAQETDDEDDEDGSRARKGRKVPF